MQTRLFPAGYSFALVVARFLKTPLNSFISILFKASLDKHSYSNSLGTIVEVQPACSHPGWLLRFFFAIAVIV